MAYARYEYRSFMGAELFCVFITPEKEGKFPTIIIRQPYHENLRFLSDEEAMNIIMDGQGNKVDRGYAVAYQHCRGTGKSSGDFVPYIFEHEDSNDFYDLVRQQPFYNGELYLEGGSYLSSVHLCAAPWGDDIKGAVLAVQDSERYNIMYRNGCFKTGLHGGWYVGQYKKHTYKNKTNPDGIPKNYYDDSFNTLPLTKLSQTIFGEPCEDFNECILHPDPKDEFWKTRFGGGEAHDAAKHANIPILLRTGWYDIYTGGVCNMWNNMDEATRAKSALVISPNDHGETLSADGIYFENSRCEDEFGSSFVMDWFDRIRGTGESKIPVGKVSFYRTFEGRYDTADTIASDKLMKLTLGDKAVTYTYNPYSPAKLKGCLSSGFGGSAFQDAAGSRADIVSIYSEPFENDTFVKGKIKAKLAVSSDCEDTCFILRISIEKKPGSFDMRRDIDEALREKRMASGGDFGLRDDVRTLCFELGDYTPNTEVCLDFVMDEHAFRIAKGERLRFDITSSNASHYVRHTNTKGLFSTRETAKIAHNTVYLSRSFVELPTE